MSKVLDFLQEHWALIGGAGGLIEILLRIIPTNKNISIIDNAVKIIGFFIKNRRKKKPTDLTVGENLREKTVDATKHIIACLALLFMVSGAFAQTNLTGKSVRFYHADSLTVMTEITGLQLMYDSVGAIFLNTQDTVAGSKYQCYLPSIGWYDCLQPGGGSGGLSSAESGLHVTANKARLGGFLLADATIDGSTGTYEADFANLKAMTITTADYSLVSSANAAVQASNQLFLGSSDALIIASDNTASFSAITSVVISSVGFIGLDAQDAMSVAAVNGLNLQSDSTGSHAQTYQQFGAGVGHKTDPIFSIGTNPAILWPVQLYNGDRSGITAGEGFYFFHDDPATGPNGVYINARNIAGFESDLAVFAGPTLPENYAEVAGQDHINLSSPEIWLNGNPPTLPLTQFFRGDMTWAVPSTSAVTADNGLTLAAGNVKLGGLLTANTTVTGAGTADMIFGTTPSTVDDFLVVADNFVSFTTGAGFNQFFLSPTSGAVIQTGNTASTTASNTQIQFSNGANTTTSAGNYFSVTKNNPAATNNTVSILEAQRVTNTGGVGANGYGIQNTYAADNSGAGGLEFLAKQNYSYISAATGAEFSEYHMDLNRNSAMVTSLQIRAVGTTFEYKLNGLPTACAGLSTGTLANVAGALTVCP